MSLPVEQIAALIDEHAAALRLWVAGRCASPEDAVQEAFCRLALLGQAPDRPVAWLYRVSRNLADKQRRADQRRQRREIARGVPGHVQLNPTAGLEQAEAVAALATLPEPLREVLVARLWGEMTLEEIGRLCGISVATALRRYEAALQQVREILEQACKTRPH